MSADVTDAHAPSDSGPQPQAQQARVEEVNDSIELGQNENQRNFARVGSSRPSSLMFTYGPGSIMDLPNFTVMPLGYDFWARIYRRREKTVTITAPRLLSAVQVFLGRSVTELRAYPRQAEEHLHSGEGMDLGVPARIFPQWMRCTGCYLLAPTAAFTYLNKVRQLPDRAAFVHENCSGRTIPAGSGGAGVGTRPGRRTRSTVPARYLLACTKGHLDEFPYDWWVHQGQPCASGQSTPALRMIDSEMGGGASSTIECAACGLRRGMREAQGDAARNKLPRCRGHLPHLDHFESGDCPLEVRLMVVGASNLWFPVTQSVIVMPSQGESERVAQWADQLRTELASRFAKQEEPKVSDVQAQALADAQLSRLRNDLGTLQDLLRGSPVGPFSDEQLSAAVTAALATIKEPATPSKRENWDARSLLYPEWEHFTRAGHSGSSLVEEDSGLTLRSAELSPRLPAQVTQVTAVERLRKVHALVGYTRVDGYDRVDDLGRLGPLSNNRPTWTVATVDHGEGIFVRLDEEAVAPWEQRVLQSPTWHAHVQAHRRNFTNRTSETSGSGLLNMEQIDERLVPPRYWLLHTFAHALIRTAALNSGYAAASISERLYAWTAQPQVGPAAGMLLSTTAPDSDGTLGGLVELSNRERFSSLVEHALHRARRCSSDPLCAIRTPAEPEEFLHGAACHACSFVSETSCERANRFLDRRFLINLPGSELGFFG